jgi:hypothetical protein
MPIKHHLSLNCCQTCHVRCFLWFGSSKWLLIHTQYWVHLQYFAGLLCEMSTSRGTEADEVGGDTWLVGRGWGTPQNRNHGEDVISNGSLGLTLLDNPTLIGIQVTNGELESLWKLRTACTLSIDGGRMLLPKYWSGTLLRIGGMQSASASHMHW